MFRKIFRKIFLRATFALQIVCLYLASFRSYLALKMTILETYLQIQRIWPFGGNHLLYISRKFFYGEYFTWRYYDSIHRTDKESSEFDDARKIRKKYSTFGLMRAPLGNYSPVLYLFCSAMLCINAAYAVMRCPSVSPPVCLSITFVDFVEMNKCIVKFFHRRIATSF